MYDLCKLAYQKAIGVNQLPAQKTLFGATISGGPTADETMQDLAQRQATITTGVGQGVSDAANFVIGTAAGIMQLPRPIFEMVAGSPEAREQMDRTYAQNLQMMTAAQDKVQSLGKALRLLQHAYGMVNMHAGDLVSQATPDPKCRGRYRDAGQSAQHSSGG
jgi:hypothetical protein